MMKKTSPKQDKADKLESDTHSQHKMEEFEAKLALIEK
jgi:hypothetical protein